jgi:hypothetical protein
MQKHSLSHPLAVALLLVFGLSSFIAFRVGQAHGHVHLADVGVDEATGFQRIVQRPKSAGITLHDEQDSDGLYIVVAIPWHTLCAGGLKLPPQQAADCVDAKASKSDVSYILPTDDDDDDNGTVDQGTATHVAQASTDGRRPASTVH